MAHAVSPKPVNATMAALPPEETKVFLSYSRKDAAMLQCIVGALITHPEFQPDFDKAEHDPDRVSVGISADEPWWQRLEEMIAGAEAMVFLVSPHSAASKVCDEEIAYAQRLGKRIVPILVETVDFSKLPPKLHSLNIAIDFTEGGPGFDEAMIQLIRVLAVNAAWLREGRRYAERAADWDRKGRQKGNLLPPGAFDEAEAWASRRPRNEPEPGELFIAWVAASRESIRAQLELEKARLEEIAALQKRRAQALQRGLIVNLVFLALVAASIYGAVLGFRQLRVVQSRSLITAALTAEEQGMTGRAIRLALLASEGDWLQPPSPIAPTIAAEIVLRTDWFRPLDGHEVEVASAVFSPDGASILTITFDNDVRIWREGVDGNWTDVRFLGDGHAVLSATFAPDGSSALVEVSPDGIARVWTEGEPGSWTNTPLEMNQTEIRPATISDDAIGMETDGWAEYLALVDLQELLLPESAVVSAAISANGNRIVTVSGHKHPRVWREGDDGSWTSEILDWNGGSVDYISISPNGTFILAASEDGTTLIWREQQDNNWQTMSLDGQETSITSSAFSPRGDSVVISYRWSNTPEIWQEKEDGTWQRTPLEGHQSSINSTAYSPDGTRFITASQDGTARIWQEGKDLMWQSIPLSDHENFVTSAIFSPDGTQIVTASGDHTARVWSEREDGSWQSTLLEGHWDDVVSATFSSDGTRIVTTSSDTTARVWKRNEGGDWYGIPQRETASWLNSELIYSDSNLAASICRDQMDFNAVKYRDLHTGQTRTAYPALLITEADISSFAIVRDRVGSTAGYDVCKKHQNPDPWWLALLFWL
ncbi:TIR domain-containing protein [Hyphomonas sp.]|uniref:TIR domain-containing protein n=1 Tax=Hyphomonas sp. TaxID=87 RepID=UPI001BCEECD1|nr:TIR domain-containing protein [Hyphomonas sp.]